MYNRRKSFTMLMAVRPGEKNIPILNKYEKSKVWIFIRKHAAVGTRRFIDKC